MTDFRINLITLGSTSVGKSSLVKRYLNQQFTEEYKPTGLEQLSSLVRVGNSTAQMHIWDIGGSDKILDMAKKIMDVCNIFLLCFSIVDVASFQHLKELFETIKHYRNDSIYLCLVGCKGDLRGTEANAISKEQIDELAIDMDIAYLETSSKQNNGVQNVFNVALIFAYKSYLLKQNKTIQDEKREKEQKENDQKELLDLIGNNVPPSDIFSVSRIRGVYQELFRNRDQKILAHITSEECMKLVLEFFLLDPSLNTENKALSEFSGIFFDSRVDLLLVTIAKSKELTEKIFEAFFSQEKLSVLVASRKHQLVRLLVWLFESQFELMINYSMENSLIQRLMLNAADEPKFELLFVILNSEQKFILNCKENSPQSLLSSIDLPTLFLNMVSNPGGIALTENVYKLIVMVKGYNFDGIVNTITHNNFAISRQVMELIKNPDTCTDAVSFLCDCLLMVYASNIQLFGDGYIEFLSTQECHFSSLIQSPSKIIQHCGLKLVENFINKKCEILAKPLLIPCLDLLFTSHRSNVIHNCVSKIVSSSFKVETCPELAELMMSGKIVERIINAYEEREEGKEYYGHLAKMAKSIADCSFLFVKESEILKTERWKKLYENILQETQHTELLPPGPELRLLRQRQIVRGLGGGIVIGAGVRGIGEGAVG